MKKLEKLQKEAAKLDGLRNTLADLVGVEGQWLGEVARLVKELENIDVRVLLEVHPDGKQLPPADASKLQRLNALKEKLSLLPGARANAERKIGVQEEGLEAAYHEACGEYRASANAKLSEEIGTEAARYLPKCGGDGRRAGLAAMAALEHSDYKAWIAWFGAHRTSGDIGGRIQQLIEHAARFDAGGPVRPAVEPVIEHILGEAGVLSIAKNRHQPGPVKLG